MKPRGDMVSLYMSKQEKTRRGHQEAGFSEVVGQFLEQWCMPGNGLYVLDKALFPKFRAFWRQRTGQKEHPALMGQFRVELTQRGFRSNGAKRPRWYGLSLRKRPKGKGTGIKKR